MALLKRYGDELSFWCPGCRMEHSIPLTGTVVWQWNNSIDAPTFTPSLLRYAAGSRPRCHSIITSGSILFCQDSTHPLAGQNVPMVDWDTIPKEEHMEEETTNTQAPAENTAAAAALAPTPLDSAKEPEATNEAAATEETKQEGPPEPGMKRCSTCKTWYPGGYEVCPHDGTRLQ
jgi:hypothetical protein